MDTNLFLCTHRHLSDMLELDAIPCLRVIFGKMDLTLIDPEPPQKGMKIVRFDLNPNFQYGLSILLKMGIPLLSEIDFPDICFDFVLKSCKVDDWYQILMKPLPTVWNLDISTSLACRLTEDEIKSHIITLMYCLVGMFDNLVCAINTFSEDGSPAGSIPSTGMLGI